MYNFFYRNFKAGAMQDPMTIIWGSFAAAVCAGCLTCRRMPAFELYEVCCGVVLSRAYIGAEVLCCLLPLVMAGVLTYFCRRTWCLALPAILCGFLFGFSVYAFVGAFCTAVGFLLHCFWLDEGFACCFCFGFCCGAAGKDRRICPGTWQSPAVSACYVSWHLIGFYRR